MLRILKDGGEIKIARVLIGDKYESQRALKNSIQEVLQELQEKLNIEIEKIRTPLYDSYEYENHEKKDLLAESFLVILKKP